MDAYWLAELAYEQQRWEAVEARHRAERGEHERRLQMLRARLAGTDHGADIAASHLAVSTDADADVVSPTDDKVTLDVGGRTFSFHRSTLLALHDSWFAAAFSRRWGITRNAVVFVDRDPRLFELYVAPFIRGRRPVFVEADVEPLLDEIGYFQLPALAWLLYGRVRWTLTETLNGALSNECRTLTHVLVGDCVSVGSVPLARGVHVWRVRLDSGGPGVMLGVALADCDLSRVSSARNLAFRWRLDCTTGGCAARIVPISGIVVETRRASFFMERSVTRRRSRNLVLGEGRGQTAVWPGRRGAGPSGRRWWIGRELNPQSHEEPVLQTGAANRYPPPIQEKVTTPGARRSRRKSGESNAIPCGTHRVAAGPATTRSLSSR